MSGFDVGAFKAQLEKQGAQGVRTQLEQGGFGVEAGEVAEAWLQARADAHQKRMMRSTTIAAWIGAVAAVAGLLLAVVQLITSAL